MSEMIERVARAMAKSHFDLNGEGWQDFQGDARAAIAAMREPTDDMRVAALNATFGDGGDRVYVGDVPIIWKAMIDAALKAK